MRHVMKLRVACTALHLFVAMWIGATVEKNDTALLSPAAQEKIAELQDAVGPACVLQGVPIPYYVLGDGIYPISKELMPVVFKILYKKIWNLYPR